VAGPSSGNTNLQITTSHVITRSKARKIPPPNIPAQKDTGGGSWIEVPNPEPTRCTQREVANLEEMAAEMEAKIADDAETEIEDEVMAESTAEGMAEEVAKGTAKGKAVEDMMDEDKTVKFNEESGFASGLISGIICNVRGRGSLSHYLVYSESPPRWCSLAIILRIYLHHNLLLVSNRSIQNTYRLVTLAVLTSSE
jgi:hypothetical protein